MFLPLHGDVIRRIAVAWQMQLDTTNVWGIKYKYQSTSGVRASSKAVLFTRQCAGRLQRSIDVPSY